MKSELFRCIPRVDDLISILNQKYENILDEHYLKQLIAQELNGLRGQIQNGTIQFLTEKQVIEEVEKAILKLIKPSLKSVINATGIVLHTNLGRAIISEGTYERIKPILTGYNTLEYNVETGRRGSRYDHIEEKIKMITGAESALVVNNNAAAVMLILNEIAQGKEVIVSRGELVEIGGAFRVPDVMSSSGCKLVEVGTTNKTHLRDYEKAITEDTRLLMKVHTSNYKIVGFTTEVPAVELTPLSKQHQIPVYEDLGSGLMVDLPKTLEAREPIVRNKVSEGIDILSFSGDKLLGGAQCGIILGKSKWIEPMKKNPLLRAFRMDKMTLAVLEDYLTLYLTEKKAKKEIPTLRMIEEDYDRICEKVDLFVQRYKTRLDQLLCQYEPVDMKSEVGGGSLPDVTFQSRGLTFKGIRAISEVQYTLRQLETPIIAMVSQDELKLNFKTIFESDYEKLISGLELALGGTHA